MKQKKGQTPEEKERDALAAVPICEEHPADVSKMTSEASTSALDEQVGGDHYRKMAIQPIENIVKNRLGFIEGNIVKYATRHRDKNGAEDVKKIIHYARMLLEMAYGEKG